MRQCLGRTVELKDPATPARTFTYDAFDRVLTSVDGRLVTTSYSYDRAARTMTTKVALGAVVMRAGHGG